LSSLLVVSMLLSPLFELGINGEALPVASGAPQAANTAKKRTQNTEWAKGNLANT
jgi:hypothetical protein